jgi:glycosyltransferase involved in cell wall biosynthesis
MIEHKFIFITGMYNNEKFAQKYFDSIFSQTYSNYEIRCVCDGSTDKTYEILKRNMRVQDTLTVNVNKNRGPLASTLKNLSYKSDKNTVYIYLDGDDWLYNNNVLSYLNNVFQKQSIWMVYNGSAVTTDDNPDKHAYYHVGKEYAYTKSDFDLGLRNTGVWKGNHLKCWRAGLWDYIDTSRYDGLYHAGDQAWFFDLAELCGFDRIKISDYILSVYNRTNTLNHNKIHGNGEEEVKYIKTHIPPLKKLTNL